VQYILKSLHKHICFIFKELMYVSWNFNDVTHEILTIMSFKYSI
jgi:hypothetical protein